MFSSDFAGASKEQIEQAFIEPNPNRRQFPPLQNERQRPLHANSDKKLSDLDRLSKSVGMSGSTLSRDLRVLGTSRVAWSRTFKDLLNSRPK